MIHINSHKMKLDHANMHLFWQLQVMRESVCQHTHDRDAWIMKIQAHISELPTDIWKYGTEEHNYLGNNCFPRINGVILPY